MTLLWLQKNDTNIHYQIQAMDAGMECQLKKKFDYCLAYLEFNSRNNAWFSIVNIHQDIPLLDLAIDVFVPDIVLIELEGDIVLVSTAVMLSSYLMNCK